MIRRLFKLATFLSLVLLAATVVLWVRGRSSDDHLLFTTPDGRLWWLHNRWDLSLIVQPWPCRQRPRFSSGENAVLPALEQAGAPYVWEYGGLFMERGHDCIGLAKDGQPFWAAYNSVGASQHRSGPVPYVCLAMKHAWLVLLLSLLPTAWAIAAIKAALTSKCRSSGRCLSCGYNLTGNTSGVCPECGNAVPAEPKP